MEKLKSQTTWSIAQLSCRESLGHSFMGWKTSGVQLGWDAIVLFAKSIVLFPISSLSQHCLELEKSSWVVLLLHLLHLTMCQCTVAGVIEHTNCEHQTHSSSMKTKLKGFSDCSEPASKFLHSCHALSTFLIDTCWKIMIDCEKDHCTS